MTRHDPPDGASPSPYYSDPPSGTPRRAKKDLAVELVGPSSNGKPNSPEDNPKSPTMTSSPLMKQHKLRKNSLASPGRNDDETPRKDETANFRDTDEDEYPDSLMVTYTLSSHSKGGGGTGHRRRSSQPTATARSKRHSSPSENPRKSYPSSSQNGAGTSRVYIENMPSPSGSGTDLCVDDNDDYDAAEAEDRPHSKTPISSTQKAAATSSGGGTYLTRKAYKFSSLKKKRGPGASNMLHRLFCTSTEEDGVAHSASQEDQPLSATQKGTAPRSPHTLSLADSEEKENDDLGSLPKTILVEKENQEIELESGCRALVDMVDRAKDTFLSSTTTMTPAEASVSKSIQDAVNEALDAVQQVTSPQKSTSAPEKKEKEAITTETPVIADENNDPKESSTSSPFNLFDHWRRKSMGNVPDDMDIETTPSWKLKAQAAARKNTEELKKASESAPATSTPVPVSASKALFPSAMEYLAAVTSGVKATPQTTSADTTVESKKAVGVEETMASDENTNQNQSAVPYEADGGSASVVSAPSDEPTDSKKKAETKHNPTQSLTESIGDDDDAFLPDDFNHTETTSPSTEIDKAIAKARIQWEQTELASIKEQQEASLRKKIEKELAKEHDKKIAEVKAAEKKKWESKEKERKSQLIAVEKERQKKLDEIEQEMTKLLEIQKEHLERHAPKEETERKLRELRLQLQAEQDLEIKAMKKQHERKLNDQKEQMKDVQYKLQAQESLVDKFMKKSSALEEELSEMRTKLEATQPTEIDEMAKTIQQLEKEKEELNEKVQKLEQDIESRSTVLSSTEAQEKIAESNEEWEAKLEKMRTEMEAEKQRLRLREQTLQAREDVVKAQEEIAAAKERKAAQPPGKEGASTPNRSPKRSASKIQKPSVKTPLRKAEALEILEREKEGLQKQINVLQLQAKEASQEHERTLKEFRSASEHEITRLKKELERRQEQHTVREQELSESLTKVDSWEKEELLEKIEQLEWDKKNDRTGGLREVQKKEELLQKITELEKNEKKLLEDHERALNELRESSENEVKQLKDEIERQQELHFSRERELSTSLSETGSFEKEDLLKKIETLEADLVNEKNACTLLKLKMSAAEKASSEKDSNQLEEIKKARDESEIKIIDLKSQVQALQQKVEALEVKENELADAKEKIKELDGELERKNAILKNSETELAQLLADRDSSLVSSTDVEVLTKQMEEMRKTHADEIERLLEESSKNLAETKKDGEDRIRKLQEDHESIIESMKSIHKEYIASVKSEAESLQKSSSHEESVLRERISQLERDIEEKEEKLEQQVKDSEENIRLVAAKHTQELDELINQLDLLESEQQAKFDEMEKQLKEKEQIIVNLTSKASRLEERATSAEEAARNIVQLADEAKMAHTEIERLTAQLQSLQKAHEDYVVEAEEAKEVACDEAREEMIERAEIQFRQANDLYVKLKKQYDSSKAKIERLDKELKETRREMEKLMAEKNDLEVSFRAEVAQANAKTAKAEADAANHAKEYRREMEGLLQAAKEFEQKADSAEALSRNVQKTLASLVVEKDKLERAHLALRGENEEMKQVCEELMSELEGRQHEY